MVDRNEEQTIRDLVLPALDRAGWPEDRIVREYPITGRRREIVGGHIRRGSVLRADLVLVHHPSGHPLVAVDAKKTILSELDALGVRFFQVPYSRDLIAGTGEIKQMRYYQHRAAQAVLRAIAAGRQRILTVLATGAGKSMLAAQLVHVLWEATWPRGPYAPDPRPRVLYLADRDVLITDPLLKYFTPIFGTEEVHRIQAEPQAHKRLYFALYQALDEADLFARYEADYLHLVIVDECHRGSARDDSAWRRILDHFSGAVHLGMTATPRTDDDADNLAYFGDPVYAYSLREGIEDGFLAPFEVIRAPLSSDVDGVYVPEGAADAEGNEVPAGEYGPNSFERVLVLPERTQAAAEFVSDYLRRTDPMGKTMRFTRAQQEFLDAFAAPAREIVDAVMDKYVEHGPDDLGTDVLQVPPLSELGTVIEIAGRFGGPGALREAFEQVNRRLYAS